MTLEQRRHVIAVYQRVTSVIWQRLSPTFGIRTINAIAKNSIARVKKQHPFINHLKVDEDGIVWTELLNQATDENEEELSTALEAFLDEFFEALSVLIGRLIVGKSVKEAESMIDDGGDE